MTVYFARAGEKPEVKIGYTTLDPGKRLRQQNTGNSEDLVLVHSEPGGVIDEASYKERFKAYHIRREWFRLEGELAAFLGVALTPKTRKPLLRREPLSSGACMGDYPLVSIRRLGYQEFLRRCARRLELTGSVWVVRLIEPETFRADLRPIAIRFQSTIVNDGHTGCLYAWNAGVVHTPHRQAIDERKVRSALGNVWR